MLTTARSREQLEKCDGILIRRISTAIVFFENLFSFSEYLRLNIPFRRYRGVGMLNWQAVLNLAIIKVEMTKE